MSNLQRNQAIDYIEFGAADLEEIKRFYSSTFGWRFTDYGPEYTAFEDGRLSGGFAKAARPGSSPLIVLYAKDLETLRLRVATNGGRISRGIFSFPGGRRFHFIDPGGNELAVWGE